VLRSSLKLTNGNAVKVLRQRAQISLALIIALLLVVVSIGGTVMAWRADARAALASQRAAVTLLGEARVQKHTEFLAMVRDALDGLDLNTASHPKGALPLVHGVDPALAARARQAGLAFFLLAPSGEVLTAEIGLRSGSQGDGARATSLVAPLLSALKSDPAPRPAEKLAAIGPDAGYLFIEPVRRPSTRMQGRPPIAVAAWLLDEEMLEPLFAEHGLHGLRISRTSAEERERTSIALNDDGEVAQVHLSWVSPMTAIVQWFFLLPFILLALVGVMMAIIKSLRFSKRAAGLVHEIETAAYDRAMRDPLTGLHNRSGFKMRLDTALDERQGDELVGVTYIDLDRFKEVNDGFGHETGDKLLIAVTERLTALCGRDVTIARLGGDEFAIVVTRRDSANAIVTLGEDISRELGQPFILGTTEVVIGGSVGIAIAPEDGKDATELVRRADISMYKAKTGGRGQAIRFHSSMEDDIRRRKMLEGELRHAIARNQLEVWYQPYMASDGETLIGVEALMRWVHPTEGVISPALFIPIAEETGQIIEIGAWAMRRAMEDAMRWPDVHLAINVSPVQFRSKDLVDSTVALVNEIGIERGRVEIEITEGVLMDDAEAAIAVIQGFRDSGLHVALDDFGTGYASLSYLRRFPFDKLKVDQAFVRNLGATAGSAAIIHSVIALGRSLGMTVHAEGVETLEHHIFLRAAGCHHFQGYYFAKPMNREATDAFIAAKTTRPHVAMRA
jgi:diguanylate cyclase